LSLFGKGFVVEFANPKALLYFAAILPQFLDISKPIMPQILIMGGTTVVLDLISYSLYAYAGDRLTSGGVKEWIVRLVNRVAGGALLLAGARMASG
jgi:threonine/homoserine/homoserine lactone efflux protein